MAPQPPDARSAQAQPFGDSDVVYIGNLGS